MPIIYSISRKRVGTRAEVLCRFYHGKVNQRAKTRIFVPIGHWNEQEGRCIINKRYETPDNTAARKAQAEIDLLTERILQAYADAGGSVPAGWLQSVTDCTADELPLYKLIPQYCQARNVAPATQRKMSVLAHHLQAFGKQAGDMYASRITVRTLDSFAAYLRREHNHAQNSISCRLRQLRTLVYWAGKPSPNPFEQYTIPADVYGDPIYLTKDERDYLYQFADLTDKKKVQRDIFIFQCHTGCRVGDMYALTAANISDGWLIYTPKKTSRERPQTIEVPLTQTALEIIDRYRGVDLQGRLLPFISEQKYNESLQDIGRQACLVRPVMVFNPVTFETQAQPLYSQLTSHIARKTFTQIAYTATGDKRLVASMTGHSEHSEAFNRYSEVTRDIKTKTLSKLE